MRALVSCRQWRLYGSLFMSAAVGRGQREVPVVQAALLHSQSFPFPSLPRLFFFSFSFLLSFLPATISWYDGNYGYVDADCPVLAICYTSGRMQLMRSESDSKPVLIDALMEVVAAK